MTDLMTRAQALWAEEAARKDAIRNNPLAWAVLDTNGVWHLRDDADQYVPDRSQFAWFLCGTHDDDDPIRCIEDRKFAMDLTLEPICQDCKGALAVAPEWLLEVK